MFNFHATQADGADSSMFSPLLARHELEEKIQDPRPAQIEEVPAAHVEGRSVDHGGPAKSTGLRLLFQDEE
jgi:hypothetical protein